MEFASYELAHEAMIRQAEREFLEHLHLPKMMIVKNPASGRFRIERGNPPAEDGLREEVAQIRRSYDDHPCD